MKFDRTIFIKKFTIEAQEHLAKLNEGLVNLEKTPDNTELIQELFRSAHTVKGSSRMMGFQVTNQVAHKMEDLMGLLRDGTLKLNSAHYDLLFEALDLIGKLLDEISTTSAESLSVEDVVQRLEKAVLGQDFSKEAKADTPVVAEAPDEKASPTPEPQAIPAPQPEPTPVVIATPAQTPPVKLTAPEKIVPPSAPEDGKGQKKVVADTIRVDMETLDKAIKSVGELLVSKMRGRKQLEHLNTLRSGAKNLVKTVSELRIIWENNSEIEIWENLYKQSRDLSVSLENLHKKTRDSNILQETIITELEESAFKMRMLPLSTLFGAYHRAVRDLAKEMGKKVELVINGEETQIDKKMLEKLDGPLNHLLRNSIDHGVEKPELRLSRGKPEKGLIHINAFSESGSVVIEIQDDGNGINTEAVRDKALNKELISPQALAKLSEREIQNFIFLPGFSTSAIITDISGRGVGLDVVKKNVEDLKGTVTVDSEAGRGTVFTITLPLTLSAQRVLLVKARGTLFALPVSSVRETVLVRREEIIKIVDKEAIRLRNQIITLVSLGDVLRIPKTAQADDGLDDYFVVIGEVAKERVGFIIDDVIDEYEVVQKPLPVFVQKIHNISGVTVLGDNEIVLILYMADLITNARRMTHEYTEVRRQAPIEKARTLEVLVVDDSLNTREVEKSIIEAHGYKVELAKNGLDALKKTEKKQYDLVVTDVEMPQMDGFTLTQNLRNTKSYRETPIIIVTSRERDEDKRRGIEVGANAYIIKGSFDQNNLIDTIQSLIG